MKAITVCMRLNFFLFLIRAFKCIIFMSNKMFMQHIFISNLENRKNYSADLYLLLFRGDIFVRRRREKFCPFEGKNCWGVFNAIE